MTTEVALPDVKPLPAASSPTEPAVAVDVIEAPSSSVPEPPEPNLDIATYSADEVREWKKTGAIPKIAAEAAPEPKADSTPAPETPAGASDKDAKPATKSAPVPSQEKKGKSNADTRKAQLAAEIQDLLKQKAALKADLEKTDKPPAAEVKEAKTDAPPAPSPKLPKLEKPVKPVKPVWGDKPDEDWEAFEARKEVYEAERDEYQEKLVAYSLAEDRQERERERIEADAVAQDRARAEVWNTRKAELIAQPGFEDYEEVVAPLFVRNKPPIPTGSVADAFIGRSTIGPQLLYYYGQHLEEAEAVGHMDPLDAAKVLTMLEHGMLHPAKAEPEAPKAETPPKPKPAVVPTKAARPATDLKATNAQQASEIEAAVAADDFRKFAEIKNREDVERRTRR